MKIFSIIILTALLISPAVAQVEIGPGVDIDQEQANILTTDNFTVDNLNARQTYTLIDNSRFQITSSNNSEVRVRLSYFDRTPALEKFVANYTATTQADSATFSLTNLDNTFYRTLIQGTDYKIEEINNNQLTIEYSDFTFPTRTQFNIQKFLDQIPPTFENIGTVGDERIYSLNNPDPITLVGRATDQDTGVKQVKLATNETGEFENKTLNYGGIREYNSTTEADFQFQWDNTEPVNQRRTVGFKFYAEDEAGNINQSQTQTIQIVEEPVIEELTVDNIRTGQTSTLQAFVVDPVGRGDIENVTFKIDQPDGETDTVTATKEDQITKNGFEGNIYEYDYTDTLKPGAHLVTAKVNDDKESDKAIEVMNIGAASEILQTYLFNPLYLGQSTFLQALLIVIKERLAIFTVLIGIGIFTVYSQYATEQGLSKAALERYKELTENQ